MSFRLPAVATLVLLVPGCSLEGKSCTDINITATANVVVLDRETKAPICDATVRVASGPSGTAAQPTEATRVAATADAPCGYRGGSFPEGSSGQTISYYVERDGYQDALVTGSVPSTDDQCHVDSARQTIELSK